MRCIHCGSPNPPGTKLCSNCGFILRDESTTVPARRTQRSRQVAKRPAGGSLRVRVENSVFGVALVLVIVVVVIFASFFVYFALHKDDPYLSATLFYRYIPPSDTNDGSVRVWGSVLNWGDSDGSCCLRIHISDEQGRSESHSVDVGPVPADGGLGFEEIFAWPYAYTTTPEITVTYDIR